jgi:Reverse transcriptase (RNA-dependent DNA polymerase)
MLSEGAFSGRQVSYQLADWSRLRESVSACRPAVPMSAAARRADAAIRAIPALFLQKDGGDEQWLLEGDTRRDDGGGGQSVEWSFGSIDHEKLLLLLRQWLEAGVMEEGVVSTTTAGTPQGGVISPLLSNIYLHMLDVLWTRQSAPLGTLVRYADDCAPRRRGGGLMRLH